MGGQRSERRKWVNFFQNVECVLYFVHIAGFARVLFEDQRKLRMRETLRLFRETFRVPDQEGHNFDGWDDFVWMTTPVVLCLNKVDLLEATLKESENPLRLCFKDYEGPNEPDAVIDFISNKFQEVIREVRPEAHVRYV